MGTGARAYRQALGMEQASDEAYLARLKAEQTEYAYTPVLQDQARQIGELKLAVGKTGSEITEVQQLPVIPVVRRSRSTALILGIGVMLWLLFKKKLLN